MGSHTGVALTKAFVTGKLENQANLLRYMAKYRKETDPALYEEMMLIAIEMRDYLHELEQLKGETIEAIREQILSVEGRAAQRYWATIARLIPPELEWPGRETRGAQDRFNSALNYGYGILYAQVEQALLLAGLDSYGGFLHADRPGKPSLVLDMIEEFRQAIVDRTIIGLVNKRVAIEQDDDHRLSETTRKKLAECFCQVNHEAIMMASPLLDQLSILIREGIVASQHLLAHVGRNTEKLGSLRW